MLYPLLLCLKALVYLIRTIFKSRKRTTGNHSGPLAPSTTSVLSKHCSEQISSQNYFATTTAATSTTAAASEHEQRLSPSLHQVRHQSAAQLDRKWNDSKKMCRNNFWAKLKNKNRSQFDFFVQLLRHPKFRSCPSRFPGKVNHSFNRGVAHFVDHQFRLCCRRWRRRRRCTCRSPHLLPV